VAAKRALKDQRRQLEQLASLQEALEAEEEGRALKRQRRQVGARGPGGGGSMW
jgi:hypothetical protein